MSTHEENGHLFDFDTDKCEKCQMSREHYEDNDKPVCVRLHTYEQGLSLAAKRVEVESQEQTERKTEADELLDEFKHDEPHELEYDEL